MDYLKNISTTSLFQSKNIIYTISSIFLIYLTRKICNRPKSHLKPNVEGKVIIFTGSSSGIGKVAALQLIQDGATVIFACRDRRKTEQIIESISDEKLRKNAIFMELDLSSFDSVKNFVSEFKSKFQCLDILVNNAALVNNDFKLTSDKIEATLQTNTFSPMILTQMLMSYIQSSNGKVINLTGKIFYIWKKEKEYFNSLNPPDYDFEKQIYSGVYQYSYSKLGNVYFTKFLDKKNIRSAVVHPGVIETGLTKDLKGIFWSFFKILRYPLFMLFSKSPYMGAQTILHLCYSEENNFKSGEYYEDNQVVKLKDWVIKDGNLDSFMSFSKRIIDYYGKEKNLELIL